MASGIVPNSFLILQQLLDRVEDAATGEIKLPEFNTPIPAESRAAAETLVALDPGGPKRMFPLLPGVSPAPEDDVELILNNTWRPTLSVTGAAGLPEPAQAGNVLRTSTSLTLSLRTPPRAAATAAGAALVQALTTDVPYGAAVEISDFAAENGWKPPALAPC